MNVSKWDGATLNAADGITPYIKQTFESSWFYTAETGTWHLNSTTTLQLLGGKTWETGDTFEVFNCITLSPTLPEMCVIYSGNITVSGTTAAPLVSATVD